MNDGANLVPSNRLKYLLGSSLRGSSTTFQERLADGSVKFVEEKPWEELEKMDMSGPGFISIEALKCQTLGHVAQIPAPKISTSKLPKLKRAKGDEEEAVAEGGLRAHGERGADQPMGGGALNDEEDGEEEEAEEE